MTSSTLKSFIMVPRRNVGSKRLLTWNMDSAVSPNVCSIPSMASAIVSTYAETLLASLGWILDSTKGSRMNEVFVILKRMQYCMIPFASTINARSDPLNSFMMRIYNCVLSLVARTLRSFVWLGEP